MASTASSSVPPLSPYTFRLRKNKGYQSLKFWPSHIQKHSISDIKLSCGTESFRGFLLRFALGTSSSLGSSETENVRRSKTTSDRGSRKADGFERELQELFDEVKSLISAGNGNEARDLLEANYEATKERIAGGEKGIEEAALVDVVALGYAALGDQKIVDSLLGTLSSALGQLTEIVDSITDDEQLLDPILVHMASMYSNLEKFEKSVLVYQRAIEIMEKKYGKNSVFLVTPYLGMAKCLGSTGKATKAIEFYNSAISILESSRGAESEDLIMPLFGLGNLLLKEQNSKDAENPFLRIVNIYSKLYGKNDGRVGMAMCSLARVKCATGDSEEAIHLYRNALQTIKDSNYMAMDESVMEKMRVDFAQLLHLVGRNKEGREVLEECLAIAEKSRGKEHPSSVTHLVSLATSHLCSKNYAEAEHLLRTSLHIMGKSASPDEQAVSFPMLHLAVTLYHLKRDEEAEQVALEALRIREKAFGEDSLPVAEVLDCLVSIQNRLGNDDETLLGQLKRVLKIQEKFLGNDSEEVLETLKKMAFYLDKLGRKVEKSSLQRRLSMLRMKFKQRIPY